MNEQRKYYNEFNQGIPINSWSLFFWSFSFFSLIVFFIQMVALQYKIAEA